jgi:hypothetical protein
MRETRGADAIGLEFTGLTVIALWWYLKRDGVGQMKDGRPSGIKHIQGWYYAPRTFQNEILQY